MQLCRCQQIKKLRVEVDLVRIHYGVIDVLQF